MKWIVKLWTFLQGGVWVVGAYGVIFDSQGRLLLTKQKLDGTWTFPGGGTSRKDRRSLGPEQEGTKSALLKTLDRELEEELGVSPIRIYPNISEVFPSNRFGHLAFLFLVELSQADLEESKPIGWEISETRFFSQEDLEMAGIIQKMGPRMRRMIEWALEQQTAPG